MLHLYRIGWTLTQYSNHTRKHNTSRRIQFAKTRPRMYDTQHTPTARAKGEAQYGVQQAISKEEGSSVGWP